VINLYRKLVNGILLTICLCLSTQSSFAQGFEFDLLEATPIGSWQLREDTNTNHKGKQEVIVMRSSLLGTETRGDTKYYWIEMVVDSYKIKKKGKRKKNGKQVVIKSLVAESALSGDPANVLTNLRGFGEEMIMQTGDDDPLRISGSGGMLGAMMQALGTEVNFNFSQLGNESVTVPAGEFSTQKIQGSGTTETKIVFKKIKIESDSTVWMSAKVPFGMVKSEGTSTTNKKQSTHSSVLLEYGMSGAESLITKEAKDMPGLGNIFGQ